LAMHLLRFTFILFWVIHAVAFGVKVVVGLKVRVRVAAIYIINACRRPHETCKR